VLYRHAVRGSTAQPKIGPLLGLLHVAMFSSDVASCLMPVYHVYMTSDMTCRICRDVHVVPVDLFGRIDYSVSVLITYNRMLYRFFSLAFL